MKYGKGKVKEFYDYGNILFEGDYFNGLKQGKGIKYNKNGNIEFSGNYLNGERSNGIEKNIIKKEIIIWRRILNGIRYGKLKEYFNNVNLLFKGEISKG